MTINYTLLIILLGTGILGALSGALGSFAVLKKQSLLGDAISHAALPGICIMFMITLTKSPILLLIGAMVAGWIGTWIVSLIVRFTTLENDAALGIILSVFFGFGLVLLTHIQKLPQANQSGLSTYLFGNAATLLKEDIITMGVLAILTLFLLFLFWKEFKLITFDPDYATVMGYPTHKLELFLTSLIVIAIVVGLQCVGVVLMSAMVIAPATAARQWTDSLWKMVSLSMLFGIIASCTGAALSSSISKLPTGPTIVVVISTITFLSLLLAPNRGILWDRKKTKIVPPTTPSDKAIT